MWRVSHRWKLTDQGQVLALDFQTKQFFINGVSFYDQMIHGLKPFLKGIDKTKGTENQEGAFKIPSEKVFISDHYIVVWLEKTIPYFQFVFPKNLDTNNIKFLNFKKVKLDPITEYENITMTDIITTCHPDRIIINYHFKLSSNHIVWDLKQNTEVESFNGAEQDVFRFYVMPPMNQVEKSIEAETTNHKNEKKKEKETNKKAQKADNKNDDMIDEQHEADEEWKYCLSQHGYLVFDKYYVNMKTTIPNPMLGIDEYMSRELWTMGPKVNHDESVFLINGTLYSTYSYQDVFFRSQRNNITPKRVEQCRYFVDRHSVVSDLVMEDDKLARVFEIWKQQPLLFLLLVTPNKKNMTPIEEAIDNNSPKVVEMCLSYLHEVKQFKLSKAFASRFIELFDMGIEAFINFLSICYFTTEQMEMMKKMNAHKREGIYRYKCISSMMDERLNKVFLADKRIKHNQKKDHDMYEDEMIDDGAGNSDDDADDKDDETLLSDVSIPEIEEQDNNDANTNSGVEKRVEVKAIEFDWILTSDKGELFLERLSQTENLRYFEVDVIKNLVMFQWQIFLPKIIAFLFVPFLAFFLLFILYTTWILNEKHNEDDGWGPWHQAAVTIGIIILVFQIFFIYVELHQLHFHGFFYFKSFWNMLDIVSIILNITVVIMDLSDVRKDEVNAVACIAVLVLWFRLFYLLRVFSETAYLISMIQAIILEMKYFVLALLIAILAFANTFYILGRNSDGDNFTGDNVWDAFIFSYKMGLGDFNTDNFNTSDEGLIWFLWFLNTLIILIILLNLVIAIMGDTFDRVQETQESTMLQEFSSIMRENEFMISRKRLFRGIRYMVIVQPEKAEGGITTSWEGKLNQLKRFLESASEKHIIHLKKMEKKLEKMIEEGLEERLKPTEDKINQKIATLELRLQKANKLFSQYPVKELLDKVLELESR